MDPARFDVVTVTLNPAIDWTVRSPRFTAGAVNRGETIDRQPGGKGVNVAAALARAGHRVAVTGLLGSGNAALFETCFERLGLADRFVRVPGATRTGIKVVDPELGQTTDLNFAGNPAVPADLEALEQALERLAAPWFVLAGSLPPGIDPGYYRRLIGRIRARGARVALDTSGEALRRALEGDALPHRIKPNLAELADALGHRPVETPEAIARSIRPLLSRGIDEVVVSMGARGAILGRGREILFARAPAIPVQSTVGAGDAMMAGLLSASLHGLSLEATAHLATAFAAHHLTRRTGPPDPAAFATRTEPLTEPHAPSHPTD